MLIPVRTIEKDGEPWFVAKDVVDILGYKRSADAVSLHCKGGCDLPPPLNMWKSE